MLKNICLISCFLWIIRFDQHPKQIIGKHNDSYGLSCSNYSKIVYRNIRGAPWTLQNVIEFCNRVENSKMYELYLPYSNPFYINLVTVAFADSNLGRAVFTDSNSLGTAPRSIEKHIHQTIKLAQYNHVSFR